MKPISLLAVCMMLAAMPQGLNAKDNASNGRTASSDTVDLRANGKKMVIDTLIKDVDTVVVTPKNGSVYIHEDFDGDITVWNLKANRKSRFHSHLSGFGLGVNSFLNSNGGTSLPSGYEDMNLNHSKSINVVLNLISVNQPIVSKYFGLTAGLGCEWHNYRFDNDITIEKDPANHRIIITDLDKLYPNKSIRKTKLTDWWLNVPVALEINGGRDRSFYASVGVIGSVLLNSHTKVVVNDGGKQKHKNWSNFYLNPWRASLMAKVGYGDFGVYATYSLTPMFQDAKGPKLYPFAVGATLNF